MSLRDPIAYTYEADVHCPGCTIARFGRCPDGWVGCPTCAHPSDGLDSEGNPVGVVAPWDEWCEPSEHGRHVLVCGTCGDEIDSHSAHRYYPATIGGVPMVLGPFVSGEPSR